MTEAAQLLNFGQYIQMKREASTLSQSNIAKYLKISTATLHNYEKNKFFPKPDVLKRISDLYKFTDEEMNAYKLKSKLIKNPTHKVLGIKHLTNEIDALIDFFNIELSEDSKIAKSLRTKSTETLIRAKELVMSIGYIEELLK